MDTKPLVIAYSGSLDAFNGHHKKGLFKSVLQWFWTYKHDTVDASTRSAYYLIKAIGILKEKYGVTPAQIKIDLWGNIHPLNIEQARKEQVSEFFEFGAYLPKAESLNKIKSADILFLPLEKSNTPGTGTLFIPGKLYEYLHAGKPILALCEPSDCRDILEKSGLGLCVEPDKTEEIATMIYSLISNEQRLRSIVANAGYIAGFDFRLKAGELAGVFDSLNVK